MEEENSTGGGGSGHTETPTTSRSSGTNKRKWKSIPTFGCDSQDSSPTTTSMDKLFCGIANFGLTVNRSPLKAAKRRAQGKQEEFKKCRRLLMTADFTILTLNEVRDMIKLTLGKNFNSTDQQKGSSSESLKMTPIKLQIPKDAETSPSTTAIYDLHFSAAKFSAFARSEVTFFKCDIDSNQPLKPHQTEKLDRMLYCSTKGLKDVKGYRDDIMDQIKKIDPQYEPEAIPVKTYINGIAVTKTEEEYLKILRNGDITTLSPESQQDITLTNASTIHALTDHTNPNPTMYQPSNVTPQASSSLSHTNTHPSNSGRINPFRSMDLNEKFNLVNSIIPSSDDPGYSSKS
ncbi:uncharacterized protein LOC129576193 isoform X2 [Sitodiplosis mosellana]|uniref:uncharacterized protein LOC129576193 isoform X2 n=1 Tax=Sitodiplosis mosellana TaxID=263140 RepID=UPI002445141A|nr:uncharacterized protein LOC129576193 isoform X2 [Sitodiplosis mosellana]